MVQGLKIIFGDITELEVDCIVNAAKTSLLGGGGVDGAIHRKAGNELKKYCANFGGCKVGNAVITPAFNLKSKFIIHTVGPMYLFKNEKEEQQLYDCYYHSLKLAKENKCRSIAFPNISTGAYGFPKQRAAEISLNAIKEFFNENDGVFDEIILCCFDNENFEIYNSLLTNKL